MYRNVFETRKGGEEILVRARAMGECNLQAISYCFDQTLSGMSR